MRIVHTGILWAAMRPISVGGFWIGIFCLLMLIPFVLGIRQLIRYIRFLRSGIKTYARITKSARIWFGKSRAWETTYSYDKADGSYGGCGVITVGFRTKKYRPGGRLEIRYLEDNPREHILVPEALWESIGVLFISGLIFASLLVLFISEVRKMF